MLFRSESILKLSALPIIAIKGYIGGYGYVKDKLSVWITTKSKLLCAFLSEIQKRDGKPEESIEEHK